MGCRGLCVMRKALIILFLIMMVIIAAISDGLFDEGLKIWGHSLEAIEILLLVSGPFLFKLKRRDWIPYLVSLIAFRVCFFDYTYNLVRHLPIFFVGNTSWWDIFLSKQPPHGLVFGRIIFLTLAVALPIKEID